MTEPEPKPQGGVLPADWRVPLSGCVISNDITTTTADTAAHAGGNAVRVKLAGGESVVLAAGPDLYRTVLAALNSIRNPREGS